MKLLTSIEINLDSIKDGLRLYIDSHRDGCIFDAIESALVNNEARFQLVEGCYYDYQINDVDFILGDIGENIIQPHKRNPNIGIIAPNIFVGTLSIPVLEKATLKQYSIIELEVQSIKSGYRDDYRDMLEFITEKCTDLLLRTNSPASQHFEIDYTKDSQSLYQKFAFVKSVIGTDEFAESVHRIVTSPVTKWAGMLESKDIRNSRRFSNRNLKEFLKGGDRTKLPENHHLKSYGFETLPKRITSIRKTDSVDTPENRFIKYALEVFLKFCTDISQKASEFGHQKMKTESDLMVTELESQLQHAIFNDISRPSTLKLNSPVLQRKEGYREVLRVWLMFDLAARLIWTGGDDIYKGGKKDIATLYPYPDSVKQLLQTSCYDCHSNNTTYPWYSKLQPVDWWLDHHVTEGKRELNFNEFASYSLRKQYGKLKKIGDEVKEGGMPLSSYTLIHTYAKLDDQQKNTIINWANSVRDSMKNKYPADSLIKK